MKSSDQLKHLNEVTQIKHKKAKTPKPYCVTVYKCT